MAVRERDYAQEERQEAAAPSGPRWLARLNEFGERHAKVIITASTGLIILTVLIFAKYFYDKSMNERAEQELAQEHSLDRLKEMKTKYASFPAAARILYRLGNKYAEEGNLESAKNEYLEFKGRFPLHPLSRQIERSLASVERNLQFERDQKAQRLKEHQLRTHPSRIVQMKHPGLQWGPLPPPARPTARIDVAHGQVKVELFEDEAPNAVASFVKLCDRKYFDGLKLEAVNADERLQVEMKKEGAADYTLAVEATPHPAEEGSLVMVKKEGAEENQAGLFQILLKPLPDLKGVTVFGKVTDGLPALKNLPKEAAITTASVLGRRDHPYEPQPLKK